MRRMKRIIAFLAVLALMMGCLGTAYAAAPDPDGTLASPTLHSYSASLRPGDYKGELKITFMVTAVDKADSLGVSYFEVHRASDGKLIDTVYGTEENGLVDSGISHARTYVYDGLPGGVSYYVVIALFAQIGTTLDGETLRLSAVTTPTSPVRPGT